MQSAVERKDLRSFGLIVGGIFGLIGLWPLVFRGQDPLVWAVSLSLLLLIPGLVIPDALKWPYRGWMAIGLVLGWINSRIIMSAVYLFIVTPFGRLRRLFGTDPLNRSFDPEVVSYRVIREARPPSHMKNQF